MITEEGKAGRKIGERWSAILVSSPAASNTHSTHGNLQPLGSAESGRKSGNIVKLWGRKRGRREAAFPSPRFGRSLGLSYCPTRHVPPRLAAITRCTSITLHWPVCIRSADEQGLVPRAWLIAS